MHRFFLSVLLFFTAFPVWARISWYSTYMNGNKVGYGYYETLRSSLDGKPAIRGVSKYWLQTLVLGDPLKSYEQMIDWRDLKGNLLKLESLSSSAGRQNTLHVRFLPTHIEVTARQGERLFKKNLKKPSDGPIVTDLEEHLSSYFKRKLPKDQPFYGFLPQLLSFERHTLKPIKKETIFLNGKSAPVFMAEMHSTLHKSKIYATLDGKILKIDGPGELQIIPQSQEKATLMDHPKPMNDLALVTEIKLSTPIKNHKKLSYLKLQILGAELKNLPNDNYQTITYKNGNWFIEVHPQKIDISKAPRVEDCSKMCPEWITPEYYMPSDSSFFKQIAAKLVVQSDNVLDAASKIKEYVGSTMLKNNAGIGILRDAAEILRSREGVCRDHAILLATLLRAAKIPARLVCGLVNESGDSYGHHAWVEVWSGSDWVGLDSTRSQRFISSNYIKLSQGSIHNVFLTGLLNKSILKVIETKL